jgi:tetratricopeptide (TPR) repeat protein
MVADLAKLRKKASELEAKKDVSAAVSAYRQIIDLFEAGAAEPIDVPLYNRLGDLLIKDGRSTDAIQIWERAVEHYMDGGFLNPAIALANKILRASPGRTAAYYTLGRCLAQKGLRTEARQNFLEYATRMQRAGNLDEAFRALKELADLVPDQEDVRLMLADELAKADRTAEAVEQLKLAYARLTEAGKSEEAEAVATRARDLDPSVLFEGTRRASGATSGGLVFLDLDGRPASSSVAPAPAPMPERLDGFETTSLVNTVALPPLELEPPAGAESSADAPLEFIDLGSVERTAPPEPAGAEIVPIDLDFGVEITADLTTSAGDPPAPAEPPRLSLLDLPLLDVSGFDLPMSSGDGASAAAAAPRRRPTSSVLLRPIDLLRADLEGSPDDARLRRAYGEALVDEGQREAGIQELEAALEGLDAAGDVDAARQVAEDLVRLVPASVVYHRRRVELRFAAATPEAAVDAALALGELLASQGEAAEARAVYGRVLQLAPDDWRAQAGLGALGDAAATAFVGPSASAPTEPVAGAGASDAVPVEQWFQARSRPSTARVVMSGDNLEDGVVAFDEMLDRFKAGIESSVDASDHRAHYDLGVAYREMGLLDEAVAQFQKALRTAPDRLRVFEALGGCFLEKSQPAIAATVLRRALTEPGVTDDALLGVLYLLAESATARGETAEAIGFLERIVGIEIGFRDAAGRLEALQSSGAAPPSAPKHQRASSKKSS